MHKRTVISFCILLVFVCLLIGSSLGGSSLWENYFSHWSIPLSIAFLITLLLGLVLKDDLFELDSLVAVTLRKLRLKVEIKKHLIGALLIVCFVAVILELVQFVLSQGKANFLDPMVIIGGSILGIVVHIIGSKLLMKRVEFELERWEDNVL
jgi:hypothetical protein